MVIEYVGEKKDISEREWDTKAFHVKLPQNNQIDSYLYELSLAYAWTAEEGHF